MRWSLGDVIGARQCQNPVFKGSKRELGEDLGHRGRVDLAADQIRELDPQINIGQEVVELPVQNRSLSLLPKVVSDDTGNVLGRR